MNQRGLILAAGLWLAAAATAWTYDTVKTQSETLTGRVKTIGRYTVVVAHGVTGVEKEVPVNEIVTIYFDDEPTSMKTARTYLLSGRYEDALDVLTKVDPAEVDRREVQQDLDFYKALCACTLALGGKGTIQEAGPLMRTFAQNNVNSYHYLEACEVLGDMMVAVGAFAYAESYYGQLEAAPWPDYKMRALVAIGQARLAQKTPEKLAAAQQAFQTVLADPAEDARAQSQKLAARLGLAQCLATDAAKRDVAIAEIEKIIANADVEEVELHARAYTTLGNALLAAGRQREALMAFLHVDLLYYTVPEMHAEALYNLVRLWEEMKKDERADSARGILLEQYKNSYWATKVGS